MKITCLSDTHNLHGNLTQIPDSDVLVIAGDITEYGRIDEVDSFASHLRAFAQDHKIVIGGNHDHCLAIESLRKEGERLLGIEAHYLRDDVYEIDGVKFYGSPWTPKFGTMSFNKARGDELRACWAAIPDDTNVLITHGPPYGILDRATDGNHHGCEELRKRVDEIRPAAHIFGHIHEGYGEHEEHGTRFVNASFKRCHDGKTNDPIVIDI